MKTKGLFLALMAQLVCLTASANDAVIDGITYHLVASTMKAEVKHSEYTGSVKIPQTVKYKDVTYSVTSIGDGAFYGCAHLTSVTIPNGVTSIGEHAFNGCYSLTSLTIPGSVKSIGAGAFIGCADLTSVTIGNGVKSIGAKAFIGCYSLTSVTIPNSVTSIGAEAFRDCSSLASVTIPNSVESIGDTAFGGCRGLTDVYCYAKRVPSTGKSIFGDSSVSSAKLHVPAASLRTYKATTPWSSFGTKIALKD